MAKAMTRIAAGIAMLVLCVASAASAQTTQPVTTENPEAAIAALRQELIDSFNQGDLPRLLSHLDPDVVVTWQNAEVCRGPQQVQAYYDKMMTGPEKIVAKVTADPKVTDRHIYGDWAVSWGEMNDHFVLTDGREFAFGSKWTATIARRGDAWKVTSFHASVNAFDNPILKETAGKTALYTGLGAGAVALVIGLLVGRATKRKRA